MTDDSTADLVRALLDHLEDAPADWTALALVLGFDDEKVTSSFGYTYSPDGTVTSVGVDPFQVRTAVRTWSDSYRDTRPPVAVLLQFERDTGRYELTFEDSDPSRWKVTPANFETIADDLRPRLG